MSAEEIDKWIRPKPRLNQTMLQPWLQKSIANLPPTCTVSLAPVDSRQTWLRQKPVTPQIAVTRPESAKQLNKSQSGKKLTGEPPALLPLITNAWSMQTMQSVKPRPAKNDFILPDLIPVVNRQPKNRPPQPVVINMPTSQKPKSVIHSPSVTISPSVRSPEIVDLCSSEEEDSDVDQGTVISTGEDKPLFVPPGISVTKIDRSPSSSSRTQSSGLGARTEQNNNRSAHRTSISILPKGTPPSLKFMGQSRLKKKPMWESSKLFISDDISIQTVTPLSIGKMSPEKREQMKQSLIKIQKKESKTSPVSTEANDQENSARPSSVASRSVKKPRKQAADSDESKGPKRASHSNSLSNLRAVRRKRTGEADINEETQENAVGPPSKKVPKLDAENCSSAADRVTSNETQATEKTIPPLMEIDVSSSDETRVSSRSSCFGSPEGRNGRKRNELSLLLDDECKELRRKGLETFPSEELSNQRVTRCRTKSLPQASSKP